MKSDLVIDHKALVWQPVSRKHGVSIELAPLDWLPSGSHEAIQILLNKVKELEEGAKSND